MSVPDDALLPLVPEVAQNLSPGRMLSNQAAIVVISPNLTSDEKHELWVIMADKFAQADIPEDDQQLVNEIEEVHEWLTQVEEEMDEFFKLAPRVKDYFNLYRQEIENRRSPKYVEDVLTGDEVLESELVRRSFRKFDTQIYGDVAKLNYPLNHFRTRMKLLQYEATKRGVSLPVHSETRQPDSSKSNEGQVKPAEEAKFTHSHDYRSVNIDDKQFSLSPQEARIIELLHKEYMNGTPAVGKDSIFVELDIDASCGKRLRDCFTDREVYKALIRKDRQNYRLNI